jgi:hypothetical protein
VVSSKQQADLTRPTVNGLSWDVVRLLGAKQKLHSLAIEDLLHTRNRTKADWYPEHVFGMFPKSVEA